MASLISIVGMVRSGSTYLEGRIAEVTSGICVGELVGVWGAFADSAILCACGQRPALCPFWTRVRQEYGGLDDEQTRRFMISTNRARMTVRAVRNWNRPLPQPYVDEASALMRAVMLAAEDAGSAVVVDSSKHPLFYAATKGVRTEFGETVVRLVRDPRAVVHSLMTPKSESTIAGPRLMKGYRWWRALAFYIIMNEAADRVVPSGALRVRYEDLDDPAALGSIVGNLEENGTGDRHQLVANPVRQKGPTTYAVDQRWHARGPIWRFMTALVAAPWMHRYRFRWRPAR